MKCRNTFINSISNVRQQIVDDFTRIKRLHHDIARLFPNLLIV